MNCRCLVLQVTRRKHIRHMRAKRWPRRPSLCATVSLHFYILLKNSLCLTLCHSIVQFLVLYVCICLKINIIYLILPCFFFSFFTTNWLVLLFLCVHANSLVKCHSKRPLFPTLLELVSLFQSSHAHWWCSFERNKHFVHCFRLQLLIFLLLLFICLVYVSLNNFNNDLVKWEI